MQGIPHCTTRIQGLPETIMTGAPTLLLAPLHQLEFLRFFNSAISCSSGDAFPFDFVTQNIACHGTSVFFNDFWYDSDA
jgi:hypothetical protein